MDLIFSLPISLLPLPRKLVGGWRWLQQYDSLVVIMSLYYLMIYNNLDNRRFFYDVGIGGNIDNQSRLMPV